MTIAEIYEELEAKLNGQSLVRRIPTSVGFDMFVMVSGPEAVRSIRCLSPGTVQDGDLPDFHGLEANLVQDSGNSLVSLSATSRSFNDVFTVVAQDLANDASAAQTADEAAGRFLERLLSWQRFFHTLPDSGLSLERQQGLFGELVFLVDHVLPLQGPLDAWGAGSGAARDFRFGNWAVEVKTSASKRPQRLHISNELQLDPRGLHALYLWCLSVDRATGQGSTLPDLVTKARSLVPSSQRGRLDLRLLEAGYLDEHAGRYSDGYVERDRRLFKVADGFPRLIERDLRPGVGDVRYSILVDQCLPFAVQMGEIEEMMGR